MPNAYHYSEPWDGRYGIASVSDTPDERLKQRITRALEKAQDEIILTEHQAQVIADWMFDKIRPYFDRSRVK